MDVAVIGAGPSGLATARALQRVGIRAHGFEASHGVGGLWDITNPRSTMYASAHLISSRTTTEFEEFPMRTRADYPGHAAVADYLRDYARAFELEPLFHFNTRVEALTPTHDDRARPPRWQLAARHTRTGAETTSTFDAVVVANGTLAEPHVPTFPGEFAGEIMHSSAYKSGPELAGKRVLIVGAGNSGCDIAVDAVHHAAAVDMSVRRGYYFVPRYIFGRPADTIGRSGPVLPRPVKQFLDPWVLRMFTGNPERFGFPRPDYKIYESHPIVNTAVLGHLGQGDLAIRPGIERFEGHTVHFDDGTRGEYDLVLLATGYVPHYPFIDPAHLDWSGAAPKLFLNIFPRNLNGIAVVGLVEATGLGWQGRYEQARLVAAYLKARAVAPERAERFRRRVREEAWPDLTGGYRYLALERMSYYVHRETYLAALAAELRGLRAPLDAGPAPGTPGAGVRR